MFTGLIEDIGTVTILQRRGEAAVLSVTTTLPVRDIALGDSIAVNGACLTVTVTSGNTLSFDVSPETLSCTTLGGLQRGMHINLERAVRFGDRMGGHIVTGHIDCLGKLARMTESSGNRTLEFTLPPENARYLITKGSVAINGVSLTVNRVGSADFTVNIIPLTRSATTLDTLRSGDSVNIETDIIGKYVERLSQPWQQKGALSLRTLAENGFL